MTTSEPQKRYQKYQRLLNNLLNIHPQDQALFTKLNSDRDFDFALKFGKKAALKVLEDYDFKLELVEPQLYELLNQIKKAKQGKTVVEIYQAHKEKLSIQKKTALLNPQKFLVTKSQLLKDLQTKIQQSKIRWLTYRRKVLDINIQENIWPLHIATAFVSLKTPLKTIYAPLLVREMNLLFEEQAVFLTPLGPWKLNEKLIFILNEAGFNFDPHCTFEELNAFEALTKIKNLWAFGDLSFTLHGPFVELESQKIENQDLAFFPGVILGFFRPVGGQLRQTLLKIIANDEIESILAPQTNKRFYQDNVEAFILHQSDKLLRVQPSNFSQDKALISALIQDTIIWGPPGTGKSQVIVNIIANILFYQKTAIVMSQKKAALDVLKKRLHNLAPFVLFILNDNQLNKEEFYRPLRDFVKLVEYSQAIPNQQKSKIISAAELKALETIRISKQNHSFIPALEIIKTLGTNPQSLFTLFNLDASYQYPRGNQTGDLKHYKKIFASSNHFETKKFFYRAPKNWHLQARNAFELANHYKPDLDFDNLLSLARQTTYEQTLTLGQVSQVFDRSYSPKLDDDYLSSYLANQILMKIENWQRNDQSKYETYNAFANAVRAGRRLPYKFIHDHRQILQELFPVIITTPDTSFITWEKESFDYVILDESSQIFAETGLPLLYLAKTKILAGDSQQMQPSNWFNLRDLGYDDHEDLPENALSILNYAFDKGVYQVMLDQNFRARSAALMSFSARHFYQSQLETVDQINAANFSKPQKIIVKNVKGHWENGINSTEVTEVLKTVRNEKEHYATILILAFNVLQKQLIEQTIFAKDHELLEMIENERLIIRNLENVQGDEADLVIISVVYDENTNLSSTYVARKGGKNALNVAVSRARECMVVIKSLNAAKVKFATSPDLLIFKKWLEFLELSETQQRIYSSAELCSSTPQFLVTQPPQTLKTEIYDFLVRNLKGNKYLSVQPAYPVGSKNIDLAIIDVFNTFKLGIQIEDFHYLEERPIETYLANLSQQEFLEFKGYPIYKIREIDWLMKREQILQTLTKFVNE